MANYNNYMNKELEGGCWYKGGIDENSMPHSIPHGRGILKLPSKFCFNGFWKNGKPIGYAEIYHDEGKSSDKLGNYSKVLFTNGIVQKIYEDEIVHYYPNLPDHLAEFFQFFTKTTTELFTTKNHRCSCCTYL
jgi:hypothetical protein